MIRQEENTMQSPATVTSTIIGRNVVLALMIFGACPCAGADDATVRVTQGTSPAKWQSFEIELPASVNRVWNTIATADGVKAMGAPFVNVRLEIDGLYEMWSPTGTRVLAFVPYEMLAGTGSAPEKFPTVRAGGTWFVYELEAIGKSKTILRMSLMGWKMGEEWDNAFDYFLSANAQWMKMIHAHLDANAPIVSDKEDKSAFKLEFDIKINATRADVWSLMTTRDGLQQWLAPDADIDTRIDGKLFAVGPRKKGFVMVDMNDVRVLSHRPEHMLAHEGWLGLAQPPSVSTGRDYWSVWRIRDDGSNHVRVSCTAVAIGEVQPWKRSLFRFRKQITTVLRRLRDAAEGRRTDWPENGD